MNVYKNILFTDKDKKFNKFVIKQNIIYINKIYNKNDIYSKYIIKLLKKYNFIEVLNFYNKH
jgi:hypothetical protein